MGDHLFGRKRSVDSLWQEIALNFYPERADFTYNRTEGEEFSDHLFSSYAPMARRELGNLFATHLRPRSAPWFSIHISDEKLDENDAERAYLELLTDIQYQLMYAKGTQFVRATREADHDYAAFGNAVISITLNIAGDGLLYRNYHLRDCVWAENAEGTIDVMHRNWKPQARQLKHSFPGKISQEVQKACEKDPFKEFPCRHVVLPSRLYPYKSPMGKEFPFVSLYIELDSETILEEVGMNYFQYIVPRWQTISGSPFAVSMATAVLLPDGRTSQVVMRTIREAGEKYVDPPMVAIADAIRGDMALNAGGVTIADMEYDERLGEVLRPISQDRGGMPIGFDIAQALKEDIRSGMFLDKIQMNPETGKEMTAFEFGRIYREVLRQQSPIFEPIIEEYNDPLCDRTFNLLMANGAFPLEIMPDTLSEQNIKFEFRSPLADMAEQADAETYGQVLQSILIPAAQVDPAQIDQIDLDISTRDAMRAGGWKAKWFKPLEAVQERRAQVQEQQEMAQGMAMLDSATQIAEKGGKALSHGDKATDAAAKIAAIAEQSGGGE